MKNETTNKELVAAGHELAKALGSASPLLDTAKLVSDLSTRLDCAIARGDALAAENAAMKETISNQAAGFSVCPVCSHEASCENDDVVRLNEETPATDAFLNSVRAEVIPESLKVIGELIRMQDNRITDQPMFVVFEKQEIIGSDEHSPSRIVWTWEGEEVEELRGKRLELLHQDGRDTRGYDRYAMQEIEVFVTTCFTEQGCKDFLHLNGHNLRQPFIYAAGSYRNNEFRTLRNWLASLPHRAGKDGE